MERTGVRRRIDQALGMAWVAGILALLGFVLILTALIFYSAGHTSWATPTAFILIGLGAFALIGAIHHHPLYWGIAAAVLIVAGGVILGGHYEHYW